MFFMIVTVKNRTAMNINYNTHERRSYFICMPIKTISRDTSGPADQSKTIFERPLHTTNRSPYASCMYIILNANNYANRV